MKNVENTRQWRNDNPERAREMSRRHSRRWRMDNPEKKARSNARRLRVGGIYLGMIGFTEAETKEMVQRGKTD